MLTTAHTQVDRLIEIRADDVAGEQHSRIDLARALVTMATARPAAAVPDGMAAATGGGPGERLHRLMLPPPRLSRAVSIPLWCVLAVLTAAPICLAATCRWWLPLASCIWSA